MAFGTRFRLKVQKSGWFVRIMLGFMAGAPKACIQNRMQNTSAPCHCLEMLETVVGGWPFSMKQRETGCP